MTTDADFHDDLTPARALPRLVLGPSLPARMTAESVGTMLLTVAASAASLVALPGQAEPWWRALVLAGTTAVLMMTLNRVSGAHLNPVITVARWAAGRFPAADLAPYVLAQVVGAAAGAGLVRALVAVSPLAGDSSGAMAGFGPRWGESSPWALGAVPSLLVELSMVGALVAAALALSSVTVDEREGRAGFAVAVAALSAASLAITGSTLNPALSTGLAAWTSLGAISALWVWWLAAAVAAVAVGIGFRALGSADDLEQRD